MPRRSPVNGRPSPSPLAASSGAPRACAGRALTPVPASCLRRRVSVALRRDLGAPTSGRMRGSRARGGAPGHPRTGHGPSAGPGGTGNRRHARRGDSAPRRGRGWPGGCCVFLVLSVRRRPRIKRRSTCSPHQRAGARGVKPPDQAGGRRPEPAEGVCLPVCLACRARERLADSAGLTPRRALSRAHGGPSSVSPPDGRRRFAKDPRVPLKCPASTVME